MARSDTPDIRKAVPSDEQAVRSCVAAAYECYVERIGKPPAPMLDDYADLLSRGVVWVAVVDERVVGLIVMWPKNDHHSDGHYYVDNIAVHPSAQGAGVGAALLVHADQIAKSHGYNEIRLYTNESMTDNLAYYPRRGFVETHRAVEAGYNRIYYTRRLSGNTGSINPAGLPDEL